MREPGSTDAEPSRWLRAALPAVGVVLAVALLAAGVLQARGCVQSVTQQPRGQTVDRSQPALLQSVRDLARYEAATGDFQVLVDLEKDAPLLPSTIAGQRTLFVAVGTVDAYVDFSNLGKDAIVVSGDGKSVEMRLPHAALEKPNLDHRRSYVFADERGIVDRVRSFFDREPNAQAELYLRAEQKIAEAAAESGLAARAEENTHSMLMSMLRSLGYERITVTFEGQAH